MRRGIQLAFDYGDVVVGSMCVGRLCQGSWRLDL